MMVISNCCDFFLGWKRRGFFDGPTFKLMFTLNITRTIFCFDEINFVDNSWIVFRRYNSGRANKSKGMIMMKVFSPHQSNLTHKKQTSCKNHTSLWNVMGGSAFCIKQLLDQFNGDAIGHIGYMGPSLIHGIVFQSENSNSFAKFSIHVFFVSFFLLCFFHCF